VGFIGWITASFWCGFNGPQTWALGEEMTNLSEIPPTILNLTQHAASRNQLVAGVIDPDNKKKVQELLTFNLIPSKRDLEERAEALAEFAKEEGFSEVMIGGAPYLMAPLEAALQARGIKPLYSFSTRISVEKTNPDGTVSKTSVFEHSGFVSR
jgi:hypothetical protein